MAFPTLKPSGREYAPGNWPVTTVNSISGAETRIRYGDKRFNATLALTYTNIPDAEAAKFLADYDSTYGTYSKFTLPSAVTAGWTGTTYIPNASVMQFRYAGPPSISSVRPGISVVTVNLVGVI